MRPFVPHRILHHRPLGWLPVLILLLFNDEQHAQEGITIDKIMKCLGLDEDTTMKNLLCLVNPKNKVLKIKRMGE